MSGDVQPRKRKDKKRKKDELGVEEHRGTAATLGEGDVFIHSQHDHGTGGHWCAKIIFFSLLAVLASLIGLIILENRGLSELEANSVESRYSGVLEGWLEDMPDDDHHDEHTLELLKHHDDEKWDDESDHLQTHDISQEDLDEIKDHHDGDENDEVARDHDDEDDQDDHNNDQDISNEELDNVDDDEGEDNADDDDGSDDNEGEDNADDDDGSDDNEDNDDNYEDDQNNDEVELEESDEAEKNEPTYEDESGDDDYPEGSGYYEEPEEHEEEEQDSEIEVERLEKEVSDEDAISEEQPSHEVDDISNSQENSLEEDGADLDDPADLGEEEEYLEDIDEPLPVIEHIVVPKGKPLPEVEDEPTTIRPPDTLADEEEYEKQQEELRRDKAQASHVWLKLAVGGALLVATHAVVSRAFAPRDDTPATEDETSSEDLPSMTDRRMTLVLENTTAELRSVSEDLVRPLLEKKTSFGVRSTPEYIEEIEDDDDDEPQVINEPKEINRPSPAEDKELFSDDEEEIEDEIVEQETVATKQVLSFTEKQVEDEQIDADVDDVPDDVEIIDDERLEEELEEEEQDDEEEISDVDDAELLTRLEAKYGRLPEPESGYKYSKADCARVTALPSNIVAGFITILTT